MTYENFEYSPFKHYLTITDKIVVAQKTTKIKSKTPSAVSGEETYKVQLKNQEQKEKQQEQKVKWKTERELKKIQKVTEHQQKRKRSVTTDDETDDTLIQMVESNSDVGGLNENICSECQGRECYDEPSKWIGCNMCP